MSSETSEVIGDLLSLLQVRPAPFLFQLVPVPRWDGGEREPTERALSPSNQSSVGAEAKAGFYHSEIPFQYPSGKEEARFPL